MNSNMGKLLTKSELIKAFEKEGIDTGKVLELESEELSDADCQRIIGGLDADDIKKLPKRIVYGLLGAGTTAALMAGSFAVGDALNIKFKKQPKLDEKNKPISNSYDNDSYRERWKRHSAVSHMLRLNKKSEE